MSDETEERLDRTEKRRRERALITDRRQLLDAFCKLPEHKIGGLDVSTDFKGYMASRRGCVVLDEDQKVIYSWNGMPDQLPDTTEIQAALGIGKTDFA